MKNLINEYWDTNDSSVIIISLIISSFFAFILHPNLFMSVEAFLFALIHCLISVYFLWKLLSKYYYFNWETFLKKIFIFSQFYFLTYILFQYLLTLYYNPIEFPFELNAVDSVNYHMYGVKIAEMIENGVKISLTSLNSSPSDIGYKYFIGIIYFIFGPNTLILRMFNALFAGFSIIILAKLVKIIFDENTAKISAIIYLIIPTVGWLTSVHLKESVMVYLMINSVYMAIKIRYVRATLIDIVLLLISTLLLFYFRTFLAVIVILSILIFILIQNIRISIKYIIISLAFGVILFNFIGSQSIINEIQKKMDKLLRGIVYSSFLIRATESSNSNYSMINVPMLAATSLLAPFPNYYDLDSKRNIVSIRTTFRVNNEHFRNIIYFFGFLGLLSLIRDKNRKYILPLLLLLFYLIVTTISGTSVNYRYQFPTIILFSIFIGRGINIYLKNKNRYMFFWLLFIAAVVVLQVTYNLLRITIRG